jgi:SAM-dependent methyltransferase
VSAEPRGVLPRQSDERRGARGIALVLGEAGSPTARTTTADARDRADYSLGVDDAERARLLAQCALHRTEAEQLIDRIGVRPGDDVLDLGCGPLGVLDLLAERVGLTGRVVGVDREIRYLAIAREELDARGLGAVELCAADATATALPAASFDLVHERLVLNNVPRPEVVIAEMVRLTRPGGHVAVQDVDWMTWTCLPEHADWRRLAGLAAHVWSGDVHVGRRLSTLLRGAGLVDVQLIPHLRVFRCGEPYQRLLVRFVELHRTRILDGGSITPEDLDAAVARLDAHLTDPDTVTLYATLFQAWGRHA